ncbi:MAG: hypothetical protein RI897_2672 [Verrucomicrobiota bacterium]
MGAEVAFEEDGGGGAVIDVEFDEDAADVIADGFMAEAEVFGDLFIAMALGDGAEDASFLEAEAADCGGGVLIEGVGFFGFEGIEGLLAVHDLMDGVGDMVDALVFEQVAFGADADGFEDECVIGVGGEEEDFGWVGELFNFLAALESVAFGEADIEEDDFGFEVFDGGDDFIGLGGFAADLDGGVLVLDEAQAGAEERVVIGDEGCGGFDLFGGAHNRWGLGFGSGDSDSDDGAARGAGEDFEVATGIEGAGFHGAEADAGFGDVLGVEAGAVVGDFESDGCWVGLELERDGFGLGVADGVTEGFAGEGGELDALFVVEECGGGGVEVGADGDGVALLDLGDDGLEDGIEVGRFAVCGVFLLDIATEFLGGEAELLADIGEAGLELGCEVFDLFFCVLGGELEGVEFLDDLVVEVMGEAALFGDGGIELVDGDIEFIGESAFALEGEGLEGEDDSADDGEGAASDPDEHFEVFGGLLEEGGGGVEVEQPVLSVEEPGSGGVEFGVAGFCGDDECGGVEALGC